MKNILFMTVGTGGESQDEIDSLAHGLLYSIKQTNPDFTVFFGSEISKKTIESLKNQFYIEFNIEFNENNYEFVLLNEIDDFNVCYDNFKEKLLKYKDDLIRIDYTSGTKTMTMTAAICATIYRKDLYLISGKRGLDGIVIRGTESKRNQNLYQIYDKFTLDKIKDSFNFNRFQSAIELLEETLDIEYKSFFLKLLKLYCYWDKFNHEKAFEIFENDFAKEFKNFPDLEENLIKNKIVISKIVKPKAYFDNETKNIKLKDEDQVKLVKPQEKRDRCYYILADLLNNADRRAKEGKYDDAIARLYRSLELIAQIKLSIGYRIKTSDVDIDIVKKQINNENPSYINKLEQKKRSGKIKLGLNDSFELLKMLNSDLGKNFFEIKGLEHQRSLRNVSILAHGLENRTHDEYNDFRNSTMILAKKLNENINKYLDEAQFPKFKI